MNTVQLHMKVLAFGLCSLILAACGGGNDPPVPTLQASVPRPAANAASVSGVSAIAVHMFQALYGMAPSNADLIAHTAQAAADPSAFARNLTSSFASTSSAALAKLVLDNLGVTVTTVTAVNARGQSEYALLLDALGQMFAFHGADARGQIILNATNLLAGLESDATYGATAVRYNNQTSANFSYASNITNTVAATVSTATANAGATQNVAVGTLVTLDGSASTADVGRTLTYAWSLTTRPAGSAAVLSSLTAIKPTFTADLAGTYAASLIVNDGQGIGNTAATVSITAAAAVFTSTSASACASPGGDQIGILGDYAIATNTWGRGAITKFTECISGTTLGSVVGSGPLQTGVTAKIDWDWPYIDFSVKAYPEIFYWPNGTTLQPIAFVNVGGLTVNHDATLSATGDYNLAYDIWVDSTSVIGQWPHKAEIMIKVHGTWTDSPVVDTVSFDGHPYDVIVGPGGGGQWKFIVFQSKSPLLKASIRIKPMLDYLVTKQHLLITDYISTIEFGSELIQGQGSATINSYSVTR